MSCKTLLNANKLGAKPYAKAALLVTALMGGCSPTITAGDAGCNSYAEARLEMPRPLGTSALAFWVADMDDRMTGTCR